MNSGKRAHFLLMNNQEQQYFKYVMFEQLYKIKQLSEHRVDTDVTVNGWMNALYIEVSCELKWSDTRVSAPPPGLFLESLCHRQQ